MARPFLSLGSINADFQFEVSADLSKGGTIPAKSYTQRAGGKGANRALFAQRAGCPSSLIGRVGQDHFAEQALRPLRDAGVELSSVSTSNEAPTGVSMIAVPDNGEKTILLAPNANRAWDASSLNALRDLLSSAEEHAVLTIDFEIAPDAVDLALQQAARRRLRVVADGSFGKDVRPEHLPKLFAIAPNVQEAETITATAITSETEAMEAAQKLVGGGVTMACIKLSDGGCVLATTDVTELIKAPPAEVVDKTGAGDAFTAALAIAMLEGKPLWDAAIYGIAASTLAVGRKGSQEAYPTRAELDAMAERVRQYGGPHS
ncbi:ribokinase [Devosia crocina]|uniref:Ribokinase n=1 Tax=Devosia crocina TaxID=429728 RepID=A0A1I7MWU1_9HYPH|nr:PfkB family carbohydrate kinase [Devosia crocina]SFV26860.1 ribokinase [Devosia crocina]